MGLIESVLATRTAGAVERRSEWGTSAIPGPLQMSAVGSYSSPLPRRTEDALRKVAIWAACDLIASLISTLPLDTYRKTGTTGPGKPIGNPQIVDDPGGDDNGVEDWLYQYMMSHLLTGNAVGKVVSYDRLAYPTQIVLYHPDDVQARRDWKTGEPFWFIRGRETPTSEIWHRRSYPMPGCLLGMSPIAHHATTVGVAVAAERFGLQYFTDGAHPSSLLTNTEAELGPKEAAEAKTKWMAAVYGTREPVVMGRGWEHKTIQVTPEESQFLDTQKYTAAECARIYGPNIAEVLGYETGGSMTYANVVDRNNALLTLNLNKWLVRVERMFTRMLPQPQYVRFNTGALLRATTFERYRAHALALANQWKVVNEVRSDEDMTSVEWGDKPVATQKPSVMKEPVAGGPPQQKGQQRELVVVDPKGERGNPHHGKDGKFSSGSGGGTPAQLHDDPEHIKKTFNYHDEATGLTARVEELSIRTSLPNQSTYVDIVIRDRAGNPVGMATRTIHPADQASVSHSGMALEPGFQGRGFATRYNQQVEQSYRDHGIHQVQIHAAGGGPMVGGYAWSRAGYEFRGAGARHDVAQHAKAHAARHGYPPEVQAEVARVAADAHSSPIDFAMIGWKPGATMWPGKEIMMQASWDGVKTL